MVTAECEAVVFAAMDLSWLNHLMAAADLPEGAALVVIDRNGTILARYPNPQTWVGQSGTRDPLFQAMFAQGQGTAELSGMDGIPRIYAFTGLRGLPEAGYVSIGIPQAVAYAPVRRVLMRNLICLGMVAVLALAAAWIGGEAFIVRPVQALVRATRRLSVGDLSTRAGLPHGPGELSQLAAAFDEMAASLEKHAMQQRLEEDLRRHNEALEEENRHVRQLNQLKSEFVSLVSHELRTPLTAISGCLDLLLEAQGRQGGKPEALLSIVKRNTDRLVKLLDGLLDLSRIESGTVELNPTAVDVMALIAEVVGLLRPQIEAKNQQLTVNQAEALPRVRGDAERIKQILINLLSNAHKYTPPGGRSGSRPTASMAGYKLMFGTMGLVSPPTSKHKCSINFLGRNNRQRKKWGAPVWDWRSRACSSSCMAVASLYSVRRERALPFASRCQWLTP